VLRVGPVDQLEVDVVGTERVEAAHIGVVHEVAAVSSLAGAVA
jgi:hypothetical protein